MNVSKIAVFLAPAFAGWLLCDATMGVGMSFLPLGTALIVHAIAAPLFFTIISLVYFTKFHYTTPLQTASIFVGFVVLVDFFVVALLINKSMDMFTSPIGTWIPFALIFLSTYLTGIFIQQRKGFISQS
ncbi:MAG: hypothetical protein ABSB41_19900 [Anaerolineales bacterium]|jgi:hypothetical protein